MLIFKLGMMKPNYLPPRKGPGSPPAEFGELGNYVLDSEMTEWVKTERGWMPVRYESCGPRHSFVCQHCDKPNFFYLQAASDAEA